MKRALSLFLLAALTAAPAFADAAAGDLARAQTFLARAEQQVRHAEGLDGTLARLRALQRAKPRFVWARNRALEGLAREDLRDHAVLEALAAVEKTATSGLLKILNAETAHYLAGHARDLARSRNTEAVGLAPDDPEALALKSALDEPPAPAKRVRERKAEPVDPPRESGTEYWPRRRPPWARLTPFERRILERRGLLPGFGGIVPPRVQPPPAPPVPRLQPAPRAGGLPQAPMGGGAARSTPSR